MESETIAKTKTREIAENDSSSSTGDMIDGERPELPSDMGNTGDVEMMGGPMGGFDREMQMTTVAASDTNEWLVPMTATGIIAGSVILSAVAVCIMLWVTRSKSARKERSDE